MATELDQARDHLHQAARHFGERLGERLVGQEAIHHLRQAARHALLAGVEAIDKAETCCGTPPAPTPAAGGSQAEGGPGAAKPPSTCC